VLGHHRRAGLPYATPLKEAIALENQCEKLLKDGDGWNAFGFVSSNFLQKSTYIGTSRRKFE